MNNNQMGMPPMATEPKKNNTTLIIIIVVVVLLVCCCCVVLPLGWFCGDMITGGSCNFSLTGLTP